MLGAPSTCVSLVSLCALASLTSCVTPVTAPSVINNDFKEVLEQRHHRYLLKDGDTIRLKLYNRAGDLNQDEILVLPDGRSDILLMDSHQLVGKTIAQVEAEYRERIKGEIIDTDVSIQVTPRGEKVHMVGQFERPLTIDLTTNMTLQEAISAVGGLRVTGDTDWALLRRPHGNPLNPTRYRIDLNDETEEIFLLPSDQVVLGRNFFAAVVHYLDVYIFSLIRGTSSAGSYASFAVL